MTTDTLTHIDRRPSASLRHSDHGWLGRYAYLVPATGRITIDGEPLEARDGAALTGAQAFEIVAVEDAEIVAVDSL